MENSTKNIAEVMVLKLRNWHEDFKVLGLGVRAL